MADKKEANVATTSLAYQAMGNEWWKMSTLLSGTQAMRDATTDMTPRHEKEGDTQYEERVAGNVLFNITDLTLRTWVGKPFSASVQFTEDFTPEVKDLTEDVDLQGNNLDVFAREWFANGVSHAMSHVMVDYPKVDFFPGRKRKDDRVENVRPYCVLYRPEDVIFAESQRIDGVETLTHVRIKKIHTYRDGWEEIQEEQVWVYDRQWVFPDEETNTLTEAVLLVRVGIWIYDAQKEEWVENDIFYMDTDEITLVTFYSNRTGFMTGKSPLLDLADLNIRHWQSMSDQIAILTVSRFPMLALSGGDGEENKLVIGPKEWLFAPDPQAKFYYVEPNCKGIAAGADDLEKLEERMKAYGAEFMKKSPDRQTASARNLDSSEATSPLQDVVYRFNDAMTRVMGYMAKWINKQLEGKAFLPTDFQAPEAATLQVLYNTWREGGLASEPYLKELQRRSILDEHFDFGKNKLQLKAEEPDPEPNADDEDE